MPPLRYYAPYPAFAAIAAALCAIFLFLAWWARQNSTERGTAVLSLTLAIVFAIATGGLTVASYQEYVQMNTWTYYYEPDVHPNAASAEVVIVPVPEDVSLLAGLHLGSGQANWSFTDSLHGRGLYVQFSGPAEIDSTFSEFAPSGPTYDTSLTMTNSSVLPYSVWIFYSGVGASIHFQAGGLVTEADQTLATGWHLYTIFPPPMVP